MPVTSLSLCIGTPPLLYVPPRSNRLPSKGPSNVNFRRRFRTTVSMQLKPGIMQPFDRKRLCFVSKNKRYVFACNAALNTKCSLGHTQTIRRPQQLPTITKTPTHERSSKLDDGGNWFPPRDGGGGGEMSSSGGFFLFGFLLFMAYLKDLEEEHENHH